MLHCRVLFFVISNVLSGGCDHKIVSAEFDSFKSDFVCSATVYYVIGVAC